MRFRSVKKFSVRSFVLLQLLIFSLVVTNVTPMTLDQTTSEVFEATSGPTLLDSKRTNRFIDQTRFVSSNNGSSIDDIYFRLAGLSILDPSLSNVTALVHQYWLDQLLKFQNLDGGFGQWQRDASVMSATFKAVQSLVWLNELSSINTTLVEQYLLSLSNSLTNGFVSHRFDPDSDVYSTFLAVSTFDLLGKTTPNATDVAALFIRAQNINDPMILSPELGGFGRQSNIIKGVIWSSEATITRAAVRALQILSSLDAIDNTTAIQFLQSLQSSSVGGFVNNPSLNSITGSYSASTIEALNILGSKPVKEQEAIDYLQLLNSSNGGYLLNLKSRSPSLLGTFQAIKALNILGENPVNILQTINFLTSDAIYTDGYGAFPGQEASLRETFDAVFALNLTSNYPEDPDSIIDYVMSYLRSDGGFGLTGSYTESTFRAISIFSMLGVPYPNTSLTISFLQSMQQLPDRGFVKGSTVTSPKSYVISTYRAIRALELLNAQPSDLTGAINYIKNNQNSDGGFGGFVGDTSDVSSTYRAIRSLAIIGASPNDKNKAIAFLTNSQNTDGGFKRSPLEPKAPGNFSSAVFTYSAIRGLVLLESTPSNTSSLYSFLTSLRNRDGGYGRYPRYSSDIAYTFTTLWILANYLSVFKFQIELQTSQSENKITALITGGAQPYSAILSVINETSSTTVFNMTTSGTFDLNTSILSNGNYTLDLRLEDASGSLIIDKTVLLIEKITVTSVSETTKSPRPSIFEAFNLDLEQLIPYLIAGAAVIVFIILIATIRRRRK